MYVNTLITLQENLATYAVEGKKVTGHVTMDSPGIIKCYIQNLKKQEIGSVYAFYAFSKAKDKGVRIGGLGTQRETKWIVNEKNVEGSGLRLEDLDAVAVVAENSMRGTDTIAMGFKNNKYIIIPLIDEIVKSRSDLKVNQNGIRPNQVKEKKNPISKSYPSSKSDDSIREKCNCNNQSHNAKIQGKGTSSSLTAATPTGNISASSNPGTPVPAENISASSSPVAPIPTGSMPASSSPVAPASVANVQTSSEQKAPMPVEQAMIMGESPSNLMPAENAMNQGNLMAASNTSASGSQMPDHQATNNNMQGMNNQSSMSFIKGVNNKNTVVKGESLEEGHVEKQPILSDGFDKFINVESIEDENIELVKIAEKLKEVEKKPSIKAGTQSGMPYSSSIASPASVAREEDEIDEQVDHAHILEKTSEELQQIIARLKEDEDIKKKISEIERQIESISKSQDHTRSADKSAIEKTLESRYVSQQIKDNDKENIKESIIEQEQEVVSEFTETEEISKEIDTSPRNALTFIKSCLESATTKGLESLGHIKESISAKSESVQEEIDYISEIDRKIQEIEERRKQERNIE